MTVEQLKNYRSVCAELRDITEQLADSEVTVAVQSAATMPYSLHTATLSGLPPDPHTRTLLERQGVLRALRRDTERFVDSIGDSEIRLIVLLKYIRGKRPPSWQSIASRLGYCAEHTPKRKLKKFLADVGNVGNDVI